MEIIHALKLELASVWVSNRRLLIYLEKQKNIKLCNLGFEMVNILQPLLLSIAFKWNKRTPNYT